MYNNYVSVFSILGGVVLLLLYIVMVYIGAMIEKMPTPKENIDAENSFMRPRTSTRFFGAIYMVGFGLSAFAALSDNVILFVLGITGMFSTMMFMVTGVMFSAAVMHAIQVSSRGVING